MLDQLDAVAAAPEHHKVLLENDQIRVLETLLLPGEETAVHTHIWSGFLYIISWNDFVRYDEHRNVMMDSSRMTNTPVPGTAILDHKTHLRAWSLPAAPIPPHSLQNVGTENIHVILTEFKT
jgi:hypothetical protein